MPERISPTRMELRATRWQIGLAIQGRDLLKEKRNVLMKEFMKVAEDVMGRSDELERSAASARRALALAEALEGEEAVRSASFAARGEATIDMEGSDVMGVRVARVERKSLSRSLLERGYSLLGTSAKIDEVARRFEDELNLVVEVAASEARLRRLAEEIQRTSRRVNALENITLPRLEARRDYIEMVLEEREREDLFRLKRVKKRLREREQERA
ncbi:MAG: V-type ATP synthase subunit D [Deltaproteobacteria bacterium]|nr:V-type ATP synthase subunit D [Deltaproteobacteria bacterium]